MMYFNKMSLNVKKFITCVLGVQEYFIANFSSFIFNFLHDISYNSCTLHILEIHEY